MKEFWEEIKETSLKDWIIMGMSAFIGGLVLAIMAIHTLKTLGLPQW